MIHSEDWLAVLLTHFENSSVVYCIDLTVPVLIVFLPITLHSFSYFVVIRQLCDCGETFLSVFLLLT